MSFFLFIFIICAVTLIGSAIWFIVTSNNLEDRWPPMTKEKFEQHHYDLDELKASHAKWRKEFGLDKQK